MGIAHEIQEYLKTQENPDKIRLDDMATVLIQMRKVNVFGFVGVHYKTEDVKYLLILDMVFQDEIGFFQKDGYISLFQYLKKCDEEFKRYAGHDFVPLKYVGKHTWTDPAGLDKRVSNNLSSFAQYLGDHQ